MPAAWSQLCSPYLLFRVCLIQCGAQALCQFRDVVIGPEVHEKQARLLLQHVTVESGYLNSILSQRFDYGIDLTPQEHKIPRDRCFAILRGLKIQSGSQSHRAGNLYSTLADLFGPGNSYLVHAAVGFSFMAERLVDCRCIKIQAWAGRRWGA